MKPRILSTARLSLPLASALASLLAVPTALGADTTTSAWKNVGVDWATAGDWVGGVPSATVSALFDSTFTAAFQPQLAATGTTQGIWLANGATQNVTITGLTSARILNITGTATLGGQTNAGILLNDTTGTNNSLTIGNLTTTTLTNSTGFYVNSAGTLTVASGSGTLNLNGKTLTLGGTNAAGTTVLAGIVSGGAGSIIVNTTGIATLGTAAGADNTFTGGVMLTAGTLNINKAGALGTTAGTFAINGGTINNTTGAAITTLNYNQTWGGNFTFTGTRDLNLGTGTVNLGGATRTVTTNAGTLTVGGVISNGSLTKAGAGTLSLTGANTYTGVTTVNAGTLTLNRQTGSLSTSSALTMGGGTFNMDNTGAGGALSQSLGALSFGAGDSTVKTTRTANQDQALTFSSLTARTAGATGNFVNTGTNSAANGFNLTGTTIGFIDQGTFYGGSNYAWMNAAGTYVRGITYGTDTNSESISASTAAFTASKLYEQVTGSGAITAQTTQTITSLNLANANNFVLAGGATLTVNGILKSGNAAGGTISGGTGIQAANNAELVIRTDLGSDTLTISSPILANGTNALTKSGTGTLTLSGTNTYTGTTTVNGGMLVVGAGTAGDLGTNTSGIVLNGAANLNFTRTNAGLSLSNIISGNGSVTQNGVGGTTVLSGENTYTGATTVSAGTLTLTGNRTVTTTGTYTVYGAAGTTQTLNIQNGNYGITGGNFAVGNTGSTATVNHTAGTITLPVNNLILGNGSTAGTSGTYNLSGGALTVTNIISLGTNAGFSAVSPNTSTITVSGTGTLTAGTLRIGRYDGTGYFNTTNTFTQTAGTTTITNLGLGGFATDNASSGPIIANLNLTGGTFSATTIASLSAGGAATVPNANSSFITIGGTAQVTLGTFGSIVKGTNSTATITFDSTTGGGGFLAPAAASAVYMPAGTFTNAYLTANGANFNVGTGKDITIGQVLQDAVSPAAAGTLTKAGTGTLTLSGANTYSGGTTVNQGTLTIDTGGTLGAGTGALTVNNNNTAAGTNAVLNLATAVNTTVGSLSGTISTPASGTNTATINNGGTGRNFTVNQTVAGTYAGVIAGAGSFTLGSLSTNTLTHPAPTPTAARPMWTQAC